MIKNSVIHRSHPGFNNVCHSTLHWSTFLNIDPNLTANVYIGLLEEIIQDSVGRLCLYDYILDCISIQILCSHCCLIKFCLYIMFFFNH